MLDKLNTLSGADFDKQYASDMVSGHDSTVSLFESVAGNSAADAELKAFAAKTLPTLKAHQTTIKDIQSKMK
jgi:putative membrane protein